MLLGSPLTQSARCERVLCGLLSAPLPEQSVLQVPPETSEEQIDVMVAELDARKAKRAGYSRRRAHQPDKDVDFINDRNAHFNKKIARAFDKHTQEIKANLERGTALPEH